MNKLLLISITAALTASVASAATIVTPVSATASDEVSSASNTINGSGLFTDATLTTPNNSITGLHYRDDTDTNDFSDVYSWTWSSTGNINTKWIEFDLGAEYELSGAYVWQTTFGNEGRQLRTFDIDLSTDDVNYSTQVAAALLPQVVTADLGNGVAATYFDFGTNVTARYVRFEIIGTYERPAGDRNWLGGLGEVRFEAVPEPSSFALLAGMFGLTAVMLRRRS